MILAIILTLLLMSVVALTGISSSSAQDADLPDADPDVESVLDPEFLEMTEPEDSDSGPVALDDVMPGIDELDPLPPALGPDGEVPEGEVPEGYQIDPETGELVPMMEAQSLMAMAAANFSCEPGKFYSINNSGSVHEVTATGTGISGNSTPFITFPRSYSSNQLNGLAIGAGGSVAYAFERYNAQTNYVYVYKWDNGRLTTADGFYMANGVRGEGFTSANLIAGGMNPLVDTGYYFGGYSTASTSTTVVVEEGYWKEGGTGWQWQSDWRYEFVGYDYYGYPVYREVDRGRWVIVELPDVWVPPVTETTTVNQARFNLYRYDPLTDATQYVGYVPVYETTGSLNNANGDLAFDANGNLYILYHDGVSVVRVVPVTAATLAEAEARLGVRDRTTNEYYEITPQEVTTINVSGTSGTQFNGLAFNYDGNIIVENSSSGALSTMRVVDPSTGEVLYSRSVNPTYGTDLASCTSFPTIELKKDIVSRVKPTDQFKLEIVRESTTGNTVVGSGTTEGDVLGVQDQQAGPVPAVANKWYRVREIGAASDDSGAEPADLNKYDTELQCVDNTTGGEVNIEPVTGVEGEWRFQVPDAYLSTPIVTCTFVNERAITDVVWTKLGENPEGGEPSPLRGTTWEIIRKDPAGDVTYPVSDCYIASDSQETSCPTGPFRDTDPEAGQFLIKDLPHGQYELREVTSPEGYRLLTDPILFELDDTTAAGVELRLDDILNELDLGDVTWTKTDENGDPLEGSEWTLKGPEGTDNQLTVVDNVGQEGYEGRDTDPAPGVFKVERLTLGTYTLEESLTPDGYIRGTDPLPPIELTTDAPHVELGDIMNHPVIVEWNKVDAETTDLLLGGSTWTLTDSADPATVLTVEDCVSGGCTGPDTNPQPGQFSVEGLGAGIYELRETVAPQGYERSEETWILEISDEGYVLTAPDGTPTEGTFTMSEDRAVVTVGNFENRAITGVIAWQKVGTPNPARPEETLLLGESEWRLTPVSGEGGAPVGDPVTVKDCIADSAEQCSGPDKDPVAGQFSVDELALGWYELVETAAPLGFLRDETPRYIQITADSTDTDFGQIHNEIVDTQTLPKTGGMGVAPMIAFGTLIILTGGLLARRQFNH